MDETPRRTTTLDDLKQAVALVEKLPPQPTRIRVTPVMRDALQRWGPYDFRVSMASSAVLGLPVVVDQDLPASPGFALDYDEQQP